MTTISTDDVHHLAQLSSLQLDTNQVESLRLDLENIAGILNSFQSSTQQVLEPTYQVTDLQNVWREDEVDDYGVTRESPLHWLLLLIKNQIKVPKVL